MKSLHCTLKVTSVNKSKKISIKNRKDKKKFENDETLYKRIIKVIYRNYINLFIFKVEAPILRFNNHS